MSERLQCQRDGDEEIMRRAGGEINAIRYRGWERMRVAK